MLLCLWHLFPYCSKQGNWWKLNLYWMHWETMLSAACHSLVLRKCCLVFSLWHMVMAEHGSILNMNLRWRELPKPWQTSVMGSMNHHGCFHSLFSCQELLVWYYMSKMASGHQAYAFRTENEITLWSLFFYSKHSFQF